MSGHFEKGRWVEDLPTIVYKQAEEQHTPPVRIQHSDFVNINRIVFDYLRNTVSEFKQMSFKDRLVFLIFPQKVLRGR